MNDMYKYINLREMPELKASAAEWFHGKWGVPQQAYLDCIEDYLNEKTEYGWYLAHLLRDYGPMCCGWNGFCPIAAGDFIGKTRYIRSPKGCE